MASYTPIRSTHQTLTGATVDTVTPALASSLRSTNPSFEVVNRSGSSEIYFTTSGIGPTVGADDTYVVGAGDALIVPVGAGVVKLIGSGNNYSVTLIPA